jgi:hypothetical protein
LDQSSEGLNNLRYIRGSTWEANTGTMLSLRAMEELGELNQLLCHAEAFVAESQARGDFYGLATGKLYAAYAHLSRDDVATARTLVEQVEGMWVGHHFHLQHFYMFRIKVLCDLYSGDVEQANTRFEEFSPLLRTSQFLAVPMVNFDFNFLLARMKLMRLELEDDCLDEIKALDAQQQESWAAHARVLEAADLARRNDRHRAGECLEEAQRVFSRHEMRLWHAYTTIRLSQLRDGSDDSSSVRDAFARLAAQGIVRPEKWLHLHIPGFALNEVAEGKRL